MQFSVEDNPKNKVICRYLRRRGRPDQAVIARPEEFSRPYETLGTHPDLVARLWDGITALLPRDCRFVVFGTPVLVRPDSQVVFAFAHGTHTYALRLPDLVRREALAAGASDRAVYPREPSLSSKLIGPEWVFCRWLGGEEHWCLSAYDFAAENHA